MHDNVKAYRDAVYEICPLLVGLEPNIHGAVLADLFAMYLAAHIGENRVEKREEVIKLWMETVRTRVPLHEETVLRKIRELSN